MSVLSKPYFHDEDAAFAFLESVLWPNGPVCPHCGNADPNRIYELKGKTTRIGLKKCAECRKPFTVKVGTVFESAHIPLHKMLQAVHLLASSKKGFSAHQLHRVLEITYKSAWFLAHRIREAMRTGALAPMGGNGGIVEADETYIGKIKGRDVVAGGDHKFKVLSLVDRDTGAVRSFKVENTKAPTVMAVLKANIEREAAIVTDEAAHYMSVRHHFGQHETVTHSAGEYGRGWIHTNTIEGYFSIFKRGMKGIYQHCGEQHLHRYLAEFDFRYSNRVALGVEDEARAKKTLAGIKDKRLTYRRPDQQAT